MYDVACKLCMSSGKLRKTQKPPTDGESIHRHFPEAVSPEPLVVFWLPCATGSLPHWPNLCSWKHVKHSVSLGCFFFNIIIALLALSFLWSFLFLFMGTSFIDCCVHNSATTFSPSYPTCFLRQYHSLTSLLVTSDLNHLPRLLSWNSKLHFQIFLPSFLPDVSIWKSHGNFLKNFILNETCHIPLWSCF